MKIQVPRPMQRLWIGLLRLIRWCRLHGKPIPDFNTTIQISLFWRVSWKWLRENPLPKYMRDKLFIPLDMNSTYIDDATAEHWRLKRSATTASASAKGLFDGVYGDKGMFSNVDDM